MRTAERPFPALAPIVTALFALLVSIPQGAAGTPPSGIPAEWWNQVQRSIEVEAYEVVAQEAPGSGFRALNPAQRFDARFDASGVRLAPTVGEWKWGLSLTGWGRPGALHRAAVPQLSASEDRVALDRGALTEWFVNTPAGLEHGFTVAHAPSGKGRELVFDLALASGLRPVFAEGGQAVDFFGAGQVSLLRYAKLVVTDAAGTLLSARMTPIVGGLRIVVDDSHAVYPITVDPLTTSAAWTVTGDSSGDYLGYSVATAGDVNGDGYSDVVVGTPGGYAGRAYLYLGGASGLAVSPAWTSAGVGLFSSHGTSVATAGDVNWDGYSDVIVGAPGDLSMKGRAYVYLGEASGLSASPAWTAAGTTLQDAYGSAVATAGDVNADGYSDVLVGTAAGKAYLYLGDGRGLSASAAWTVAGGATFGDSVATAGDVNADGFSDVVIGAFDGAGKAYLYMGGPSGLATSAAWTAAGEATIDNFGRSVSTAGDVNGDGYADVVVGADGAGYHDGKAFLYLGSASGLAVAPSWTAAGEDHTHVFAYSVATAGDVNGDGYADVVVGAHGYDDNKGKAYLYLGGASGLAVGAAWTATGNGHLGYSTATGGDVNGDGYSDVIVGAIGENNFTGKAYLYFGCASGLAASTAWNVAGADLSSDHGASVSKAGDVNGDGYSDVIVGAPGENGFTGKAYLYWGGVTGLSSKALWTAEGEAESDAFGSAVATAGDVNGDGYSDVVVGAYGSSNFAGKAYLYLGSASGLSASAAWTAVGAGAEHAFAAALATAGDVNRDGYSDVIVGAYGASSFAGEAYLYLGQAGGLSASPAWTAQGQGDDFGIAVATAGDVNGDGYADVVVGASGNINLPGKAYVYLGRASGLWANPVWTRAGEAADSHFGASVATAGDVNGDGYSDVVVGAPLIGDGSGKAYVYLGGAAGLSANAAWTAAGAATSITFGSSVTSAGDVNGDGYSDLAVGASLSSAAKGAAYLYLGGASGLSADAVWTAAGETTADSFGYSVAGAGDVNGDGFPDLVVGAYGNSSETGKAYVYLGGGGAGRAVVPRQLRADLSALIAAGAPAYEQQLQLALTQRSPVGRVWRTLQWQIVPWGSGFSPTLNPIQGDGVWYNFAGVRTIPIGLPQTLQRYVWRVRLAYDPVQSPFLPRSPWFTLSDNGLYESDLLSRSEAGPGTCIAPDEELYIVAVSRNGNGKPVLHYHDLNSPDFVTGYNVYRAATPAGPWTLLGLNVADMDAGMPDIQYVDQTADTGGSWYYRVAAWNAACGAEGPY